MPTVWQTAISSIKMISRCLLDKHWPLFFIANFSTRWVGLHLIKFTCRLSGLVGLCLHSSEWSAFNLHIIRRLVVGVSLKRRPDAFVQSLICQQYDVFAGLLGSLHAFAGQKRYGFGGSERLLFGVWSRFGFVLESFKLIWKQTKGINLEVNYRSQLWRCAATEDWQENRTEFLEKSPDTLMARTEDYTVAWPILRRLKNRWFYRKKRLKKVATVCGKCQMLIRDRKTESGGFQEKFRNWNCLIWHSKQWKSPHW